MNKKKSRVCIIDSVYSLLIYLLCCEEDEITNTFYFFGNGIHPSIRKRFPHHYHFDKELTMNKYKSWLFLTLRIGAYFRWPFLRKAAIYGHDHLPYSSFLIGNNKYTYIEDAPSIFSVYLNGIAYKEANAYWASGKLFYKKVRNKFIGGTFMRRIANNSLCEEVILTQDDSAPYLDGKKITIISSRQLWEDASESKRKLILKIYDISDSDMKKLKEKSYILFTQQFSTDKLMTDAEQVDVYRGIIDKYDRSKLLIKPHPRDSISYKKYFPDVEVFDKIVPMQLLDLLGTQFTKAITICSSSVLSFSYKIDIDWYGTSVHPNLYSYFGDLKLEDLQKNT